jgi:hypothetical protein
VPAPLWAEPVSAPARTRRACAVSAVAAFALIAVVTARAQAPEVGGSVPSVLSLSLSQPSGFAAARGGRGPHGRLYVATIGLSVTSTEMPTRLSISDGEALGGARRGHLLRGERSLSPALEAAAGHGPYRSLDSRVDPQLRQWSEPISSQATSVHLRQAYRGSAHSLLRFHKLLLVTVTAGGP